MSQFKLAFALDDEFRLRNRSLTKQERSNLERLIEQEQCADGALTVALIGNEKILCDGYNTLAICQEQGVAPSEPRYLPFKDRAAVLEWMDLRQRARRNLTPEQMAENRTERIERVVEARTDGKSIRTIAEEEKVSVATIQRDIEEATVSGDTVEPEDGKVVGKDKKKRAARSGPKKPKKPLRCKRCKRMNRTDPNCEQCLELNEPKSGRARARDNSGPITLTFDAQFEKCYDALLLAIDRRATAMGKDKCYTACIAAAFECRKQYKAWVIA
jgi:hypothetical protein